MNTGDAIEVRRRQLFDNTATAALATTLTMIAAMPSPDADYRLIHAWIIDELERRYPAAAQAVAAAFDAYDDALFADPDNTPPQPEYAAILLAAIPVEDLS